MQKLTFQINCAMYLAPNCVMEVCTSPLYMHITILNLIAVPIFQGGYQEEADNDDSVVILRISSGDRDMEEISN
eukprot:1103616-Ditylum_brightwellii.AAC.1